MGNALIAELIGIKIFALEDTLGLEAFAWELLRQSGSLGFTASVLLWPVVFVMTPAINEYFGLGKEADANQTGVSKSESEGQR